MEADVRAGVPGATSRDVYAGIGRPVQGMSSAEIHHDGQPGRKRQPLGLARHGAATVATVASGGVGIDERERAEEASKLLG